MNKFRKWFPVILITLAIFAGLYVGVYLCFIGGIVGIVKFLITVSTTGEVTYASLAWNIFKILSSGFLGWLTVFGVAFIGETMFESSKKKVRPMRKSQK